MTGYLAPPFLVFSCVLIRLGGANAGTALSRQQKKRRTTLLPRARCSLNTLESRWLGRYQRSSDRLAGLPCTGEGERIMMQELPLSIMLLATLHAYPPAHIWAFMLATIVSCTPYGTCLMPDQYFPKEK